MDEYLTAAQISKILNVHAETVKGWLRSGTLRGFVLSDRAGWRVSRADLNQFIEDRHAHGPVIKPEGEPREPE